MSRITKDKELQRTEYTQEEIKAVHKEVNGDLSYASFVRWLLKHKAIKLRDKQVGRQEVVVLQYGEDIPYVKLSEKWHETVKHYDKIIFAERMRLARMETLL